MEEQKQPEVKPKQVQKFKDWSQVSSQTKTTEYNPDNKELIITFSNGARYRYAQVSLEVWEKLLKSTSIGKFINTDIKPNYECKKLN